MNHPMQLLEPMTMPNPHFPIKLGHTKSSQYGQILFSHHWHRHIEFLYFTSGEALIECNSVRYQVRSGDLIVVNSNELHHGINLSTDLGYIVLIADLTTLQSQTFDAVEAKFMTPITQNRILFQNKITDHRRLNSCFDTLKHEFATRRLGYELSIKAELYRLLTILLRNYVKEISSLAEYNTRMNNLERFTPILDYIEQYYDQHLSVELLSKRIGLSRFHFSRLFKELTGRTVVEYINKIRINKAESLLHNTSLTISEIAHKTGFNDVYYFSKAFKKANQMSPSAMRNSVIKS